MNAIKQFAENDIDFMDRAEVLAEMKRLIVAGVLKQSDKYLRLRKGTIPTIEKNEPSLLMPGDHKVMAYYWSDSAVFYDVYKAGGAEMNTVDFLNSCVEQGAYTKRAWSWYAEDKNVTPADLMEFFRIEQHVKPAFLANGTYEECGAAVKIVYEWNRTHIGSDEEMMADASLNFIRISRKKGEIESTRCMNGECIGSYLISASETAF